MKILRLIFAIICIQFIFVTETFGQQVPQFSQYIFNPVFINPAYAGYKQQLYLQTYYRKQWTGVTGSPETFALSADGYLGDSKLGVGGQILSDRLGPQRTNAVYGNISYHLRLTKTKYLSFGAAPGIVNTQMDGSILNPDQGDDPIIPASRERLTYPDMKLGMFLYDERFYVGLAADQMLSSILTLDKGDMVASPTPHIYLTGGYHFDLNYNFSLIPSIMYMDDFNSPARLDLNMALILNDRFWLGAGYRMGIDLPGRDIQDGLRKSTAVIGMFQFLINESLRLGYAYDHSVTRFNVGDFTTHDISIAFLFPPKRVKLVSPRFF